MKSIGHVNTDSANYLYLVFDNVDGYIIKESNKDKYLIFILQVRTKRY